MRPKIERELWNELRCGGDVECSEAAVHLAALLRNRGEVGAARELLDYAPTTADPVAASRAWLACAELLEELGEELGALRAYRQAAELVSPHHSPDVAIDLAARAQENGNALGAARLYEAVIAAAPAPALIAIAGLRLASIHCDRGQREAAISSLRVAREHSGPALLPAVELALAEELLDSDTGNLGHRAEAEELLASVRASDHPDLAPKAALRLACELGTRGEFGRAYELLGAVVGCQHPDFAPLAEAETSFLMHRELESFGPTEEPGRRSSPSVPAAQPSKNPAGAEESGSACAPEPTPEVPSQLPGVGGGPGALCNGALWHLDGLLGVRQDQTRKSGSCGPSRRSIRIGFDHHTRAEVDLVLPRHYPFSAPAPLHLPMPDSGQGIRGMLGRIRDFLVGSSQPRSAAGELCAWTIRFEAEAIAVRLGSGGELDPDSSFFHALRFGDPDPGLRALLLALVAWEQNPRSGLIEIDWHDPIGAPVAKTPDDATERWRHACSHVDEAWGRLEAEVPADRISLLLKGEWEPLHGLEERRRRAEAAVIAESVESILVPQPAAL